MSSVGGKGAASASSWAFSTRVVNFVIDGGGLGVVEGFLFAEEFFKAADGVVVLVFGDFFLGAVFLGVGHGVAAVAVGFYFEEERAIADTAIFDGVAGHVVHGEAVHAVDFLAGDTVGVAGAEFEVGDGGGAVEVGSHAVAVIFDHEDAGEFVDAAEVEGFVEGTLVDGTVAEVAECDAVFLTVLGSPAETGGQRNVATDNRVTTEEILFFVEEVHGAALAVGASGDFAVEFGEERGEFHAARDGVAVVAVGGDDVILGAGGGDGADGDGFLADVEVAESADLLLLVGLGAFDFKLSDEAHLAVPVEQLGGGGFNFWDGGNGSGGGHLHHPFVCGRTSVWRRPAVYQPQG